MPTDQKLNDYLKVEIFENFKTLIKKLYLAQPDVHSTIEH